MKPIGNANKSRVPDTIKAPVTEDKNVAAINEMIAKDVSVVVPIQTLLTPPTVGGTSKSTLIKAKVIDRLKTAAASITQMAVDLGVTEREIRQAIDAARSKSEPILRLSKGTFGYASYASAEKPQEQKAA